MTDDLIAIKQILPAEGWYALYEQGDGAYHRCLLSCWALVQRKDPSGSVRDMVEGMTAMEYGIESAEASANFTGYCHQSELDQYPEAKDE